MPHPAISHRRPRPPSCLQCTLRPTPQTAPLPTRTPAYAIPPPLAAAGMLAVLSVSVTLTLQNLLPHLHPVRPDLPTLSTLRRRMHKALTRLLQRRVRPPPPSPPPRAPPVYGRRLDEVRDRALAQLENERIAFAAAVSDEAYRALPALQRRELLASALRVSDARLRRPPAGARADAAVTSGAGAGGVPEGAKGGAVGTVEVRADVTASGRERAFWKMAESVNGRAAALGFVLCLAREIVEPGHPSLFEQVVDVVVPIAQKTPPFLVAVCDHLVDLLT